MKHNTTPDPAHPAPWSWRTVHGDWFLEAGNGSTVLAITGSGLIPTDPDLRAIAAVPELIAELCNLVVWLEADRLGYCAKELHAVSLERHLNNARAALAKAGQA